jgi:hypothetical protein
MSSPRYSVIHFPASQKSCAAFVVSNANQRTFPVNDTAKQVTQVPQAAQQTERPRLLPVSDTSEFAELLDSNRFAQIQRVAQLFSESTLVPEVFQGKPANCAVALQMAFRMRVDPMMLMQNMYIVKGRPGIEAKLAIALINSRGPFEGPVQWILEGEGGKRSWTAFAVHRATGEKCAATVTWEMAVAEGWTTKDGSKWKTIPDIMGRYRSAMFLGRLYCPEVLLGLPTSDELDDFVPMKTVLDAPEPLMIPQAREVVQPRARTEAPAPQQQPQPDVKVTAQRNATTADLEAYLAPRNGDLIDHATGEVVQQPAAQTPQPHDSGLQPAPQKTSTKIASDAQRKMITDMAKRAGYSVAQLDEQLIEAFAVGIDELPMDNVSAAVQLVRKLATKP